MIDTEEALFKCGLQVERGYVKAPREYRECQLRSDWDWHRLIAALKPGNVMEKELRRLLLREGFRMMPAPGRRTLSITTGGIALRWPNYGACLRQHPPMTGQDPKCITHDAEGCPGFHRIGLVESMLAVFVEVTPLMNLCMQTPLHPCANR